MATRLLLFASIIPEKAAEFEAAFADVRRRVATVEGHINDELLRHPDDPGQYLLVSDWESKEQCTGWLASPSHDEMTAPMRPCFARRSDVRFYEFAAT